MPFSITREIGIDMGHRIPTHGSKCWSVHGHRYRILATVQSSELYDTGEQRGMVLDFGFLASIMMQQIDGYFDHALCLWVEDPWLPRFVKGGQLTESHAKLMKEEGWTYIAGDMKEQTKLVITHFIPTAENLAKHWHRRLVGGVLQLTMGKAFLSKVEVFETPNCSAVYPASMSSLPGSTHDP